MLRWDDNIKMDLKEIVYGDIGGIQMAHDRGQWWNPLNTVLNLRVP
jgi:hypothetical protein